MFALCDMVKWNRKVKTQNDRSVVGNMCHMECFRWRSPLDTKIHFKMLHIIVEVFRFTSGHLHEISCHFIEVQSIIRVWL